MNCLDKTDRLLRHEAETQGISLVFELPDIHLVTGNRIQVAQVLLNLIRNAMEAMSFADSPVKEVTVSAHPKSEWLEVWVSDTGPGIDPDVKLFKQFETSKKNGMGLGLSICRTIIEANGGRLWFDAKNTERTRFCFTLRIMNETV